jgi:hypothetical protein
MTSDQILTSIIKNTYTKAEILRRITLLRQYLEQMFFSGMVDRVSDNLRKLGASTEDVAEITSWGDEFFASFTRENTYDILNEVSKAVENLPIVTVYLAIVPFDEDVKELGNWFRKHLDPKAMLDIRTNTSLIGGCAYVWNGVYREFALHYFLSKNVDEIAKIISQYATTSNKENQTTI